MEPLIDAERVNTIFMDCMFRPEEIEEDKATGERRPKESYNYYEAPGPKATVILHADRIEKHKHEINTFIDALPREFRDGYSFLAACNDVRGVQWTGLHQRMEQLFQLGIAAQRVTLLAPREVWQYLPGGMPYYQVKAGA